MRSDLPSRSPQKGPRQQWAEPQTGSSSIPILGAKKRETKSKPGIEAGPVTITRSGGAVTAAMNAADTMTGTLDPSGALVLVGGSGSDSLRLAATVQNYRAAGSAQAGLGSTRLAGSFTLDPVTGAHARKPMQQWETDKGSPVAPPAAPTCNWWCGFRKWLGI